MAALMVLTRLKEQGVEEPGLLPSDAPPLQSHDGGQGGGGRVQYNPHLAHGSATLRQLSQVTMCP